MKKLINSIKNKLNSIAISAKAAIASTSGEGYIDTGVKIIIYHRRKNSNTKQPFALVPFLSIGAMILFFV